MFATNLEKQILDCFLIRQVYFNVIALYAGI